METFREDLAAMGYKFQFITLAGFHALNTSMFELSKATKKEEWPDILNYKKRICVATTRIQSRKTPGFVEHPILMQYKTP
jgi:isocitrate lyase